VPSSLNLVSSESLSLIPLLNLAEQHFGLQAAEFRVQAMPGGMSSRRFFRVEVGSDPSQSAVGMYFADASRSDEGPGGSAENWPFIEVQQLLESRGVRVPKLFKQDTQSGWLLVEDLTDETLAAALQKHPQQREALYQSAVRALAHAQVALTDLPKQSIVSTRRFNFDLLLWEIEHFREYALAARSIELNPAQSARFQRAAGHLAQTIEALAAGFVHRDYQSRNLMVAPELPLATLPETVAPVLAWLDFQDALLGPRVYDLVALLNDSYQSFTREFVERRLEEYVKARGLPASALPQVQREFDLCTVQRKLKDAGRFVFFHKKSGDASYLPFVSPTIEKIRASLSHLEDDPVLFDFASLLQEVLPEADLARTT
jgi:N-acetylmuramate 1-kinase